MKPVVATLLCLFTKVLQAQLEGFEVSGPIYVYSNRDPKVLGFQRIQYIDSLEEAEDTVEAGVKTAADFVSTNFQTAEKDVLAAVNSTEHSISGRITGVSNSLKSTMSNVGDKVQQAASQSKIFILKSTESAEGYFSSAFKSVKDWFFQLETEAKELIHFVL
ncbi:unnamed protein product [Orchesella dallaii]|uniref:Uncharacterized protein n=1 Tax=Orchesella dallaii TaxID=48710 RepID=A0ABP1Q7Y7_9HEXA